MAVSATPESSTQTAAARQSRPNTDNPGGLRGLWLEKNLLALMVKRDCIGRYKGSFLGMLWPMINPIGHLILYTFLFGYVLKVKFGMTQSTGNFALYLMAGLLPWSAFSESLSRASTVILEHPNLVKRVVFPLQILPLIPIFSAIVTESIAFALLLIAVLISMHSIPITVLFVPLIVVAQFLLTSGICWIIGSLSVFVRDIRHMMALGLSAWMYATPIVYPATALPEPARFLLWVNPMAGIVTDYRRCLLDGLPPDWPHFAMYAIAGLILFVIGLNFFEKTQKTFADVM